MSVHDSAAAVFEHVLGEHARCYPLFSKGVWKFICGATVEQAKGKVDADRKHVAAQLATALAQPECECPYTDPSTWLSAASCGYGSGYEPGSMQEWNPDCPAHPPHAAQPDTLGDGDGVPVERLRALHEDWRIRSEGHLAAVSDRPRIIELRRCMAAIAHLLAESSATASEEDER